MEFNEKLKELRKESGLSQEELANLIFVSSSAIARWENGLGIPSEDNIDQICKYFDVTREEMGLEVKKEKNTRVLSLPLLIASIALCVVSICLIVTSIVVLVRCNSSKDDEKVLNFSEYDIRNIYYKKVFINSTYMEILHYSYLDDENFTSYTSYSEFSRSDAFKCDTIAQSDSYSLSFWISPTSVTAYYVELDEDFMPYSTQLASKSEWFGEQYSFQKVSVVDNTLSFTFDAPYALLELVVNYEGQRIDYYIMIE